MTESESQEVIKRYAKEEKQIEAKPDCAIGVGYTTCMDVNFRAVDLFTAMEKELKVLVKKG